MASDDPSDTPTPRITSFSLVWRRAAQELGDKCREAADLVCRDPAPFDADLWSLLGAYGDLAKSYEAIFAGWQVKSIDTAMKLAHRTAYQKMDEGAWVLLAACGVKR